MRITESTWRITEGSHSAFCSSVLSLKERIKSAEQRSSQHIAEQFREAVLYCPMTQSTTILKDAILVTKTPFDI
ncbi:hypothetical protein H5410_041490 [Solanum commersonii]|uniref:Uncharacterized protein n=1 Tax=Solanum commersonii TaxID=4109 RepID=A0A9J5XUX2_SOLCO|nr:hypothetical protein H5410_041490 [Solanum commersonii]